MLYPVCFCAARPFGREALAFCCARHRRHLSGAFEREREEKCWRRKSLSPFPPDPDPQSSDDGGPVRRERGDSTCWLEVDRARDLDVEKDVEQAIELYIRRQISLSVAIDFWKE